MELDLQMLVFQCVVYPCLRLCLPVPPPMLRRACVRAYPYLRPKAGTLRPGMVFCGHSYRLQK